MAAPDRFYAYRRHKSGSCDSICLDCFRTISSAHNKAELAQQEQDHICNPVDLLNLEFGAPKQDGDQLDA